mmetsp:Transcript_15086/g.22813  ORF Transcript_15086/g.22813 Transcript_15086/m.22813 type:complete len:298 (-) Transcript_15086:310-1203(-)
MLLVGKLKDGDKHLKSMQFGHPKHDKPCCYLVGDRHIYEMQTFEDDEYCSLFVDDTVCEKDTLYVVNAVDPIYLLIPSLLKQRKHSPSNAGKYCLSPLDQLLSDQEMQHIVSKLSANRSELHSICDYQQVDDETYYVLNDAKVVSFLDGKLKQIQDTLSQHASITIHVNALHDALCILNEYMPDFYFVKLCEKYELNASRIMDPRKRKKPETTTTQEEVMEQENYSSENNFPDAKKRKYNPDNSNNALDKAMNKYCQVNPKKSVTSATPKSRAISKLSKASTKGMKSMTSYFGVKKK